MLRSNSKPTTSNTNHVLSFASHGRMETFQGFDRPSYTQVPDQLVDELMPKFSGADLKVLLYIIRRTLGLGKHADTIPLNQITNGRKKKDGTVVDRGTGLSDPEVQRSLKSLEAKNVIVVTHTQIAVHISLPTGWLGLYE